MGHPSVILENSSSESNVDHRDPAEDVLGGNNISNWSRNHYYDFWAKNVAVLCPCVKNLPKAKLENNGPMSWVEKISI